MYTGSTWYHYSCGLTGTPRTLVELGTTTPMAVVCVLTETPRTLVVLGTTTLVALLGHHVHW